jgi:hypothetical protein
MAILPQEALNASGAHLCQIGQNRIYGSAGLPPRRAAGCYRPPGYTLVKPFISRPVMPRC